MWTWPNPQLRDLEKKKRILFLFKRRDKHQCRRESQSLVSQFVTLETQTLVSSQLHECESGASVPEAFCCAAQQVGGPLAPPSWDESRRCDATGRRLYWTSPQSVMEIFLEVCPDLEPYDSTFFTTSIPSVTRPNTTCLPSSLDAQRAQLFLPPHIQNNSSMQPDWLFFGRGFDSGGAFI